MHINVVNHIHQATEQCKKPAPGKNIVLCRTHTLRGLWTFVPHKTSQVKEITAEEIENGKAPMRDNAIFYGG